MLLSLFCGAGGLDAGFEAAGHKIGLAYDKRPDAVKSYNLNRGKSSTGKVADISTMTLADLDADFGDQFNPSGVLGGPPCQSFSKANSSRSLSDPRSQLVATFVSLALALHKRSPLDFIVMENVPELIHADDGQLLAKQARRMQRAGFRVRTTVLNAADFGVPQTRQRMFLVAVNKEKFSSWVAPSATTTKHRSLQDTIRGLPEPRHFERDLPPVKRGHHPNHWCMKPKSPRFFNGTLKPGYSAGRSFKTLSWDKPSLTVSYGNREVHIHPGGKRRLSVFEAMLLQGFDKNYVLIGTLSSQITQVSEAVPPPLARAVAASLPATQP